ncbi:MAG: S8 family serine peptidase [Candidatus Poseidonia sp.]|nr:S8 family serine peptidase [Poseidonia sp.]
MAGGFQRQSAFALVLLLLVSTNGMLFSPVAEAPSSTNLPPEWVRFDVKEDVYFDAVGVMDDALENEERDPLAIGPFGTFDVNGLTLNRPVPASLLEPRFDLLLVLVSNEARLHDVRLDLDNIEGLAVREFVAPSGLLLQGTPLALQSAEAHPALLTSHAVPLGMLLEDALLDLMLLVEGEEALQSRLLRLDGWRDDLGPLDEVNLLDGYGGRLVQSLGDVARQAMDEPWKWDDGRYEGRLLDLPVEQVLMQPAVMQLRADPAFAAFNDQARNHMQTNTMTTYFTTDLDGSGQIVAVADAGLDEDHGDFGSRVVGSYDVIGDGSTADKHSGHGTHVSCTVLGDGFRGGYGGVAQAAELYFQAMENDNTGNFQSPSLNNLLNTAYNAGARTHTNSWGSSAASQQSKYNSETEDVDDRANYYDRYYNGAQGLTILFAAGNDGPNAGTVSPPATAKNVISVGNHKNRYSGSPDVMMSGSSRGPTEDGRIKPDLVAPGGFVRSCRAQEATDTGGASWSNTYYLEYTGTSMATPNAAGAALMIREYLQEIAQRPSPQGALVKALLVLGAQDIGARDIPNNDEGWGRVNLRNTLAPANGQGIWVDDRSVMSGTGNSKTYSFNVSQASGLFKVVLTWSDERGSRFSTAQLVNDLDLEVTAPDGTQYLGNDFANGRSATGGSADDVNNLEVVLIDAAAQGTWTVKVKDAQHSGSKTQPYAIAVLGHGVNDLRPDPKVVPEAFAMNVGIPQVGDSVQLTTSFFNFGNVKANTFPIAFEVNGNELDRTSIDLGAGSSKVVMWPWTPQSAGATTLSFIIDPDDIMEEIREDNNRLDVQVNVTAPGVKLETATPSLTLASSETTTTSWNVSLTNTALLATNASMQTGSVTQVGTGQTMPWYIGSTDSNFTMEGQASEAITVTLVHPAPPAPGRYQIDLLGLDVDNGVDYPLSIELIVPDLPEAALEFDYETVPVHPSQPTNMTVRFFNNGNAPIGYDLFLEAPAGWRAGFTNLGSEAGATSGSTGLINSEAFRAVGLVFTPPQVMTAAGAERVVKLTAVSQTEQQELTLFEIPIQVSTVREIYVNVESSIGTVRPDSSVSLRYSLEHKGNVDLRLTPSFELPSGWSVTSSLAPIDLPWASSKNLLYTLEAGPNARSGDLVLNLDNGSTRFTWEGSLEVEVLPEPELTFVGLELADGTTFGTPAAGGSHPSGEAMTFTWLLSNAAETVWAPSASLQLDQGLFGDCTPVDSVGQNDVVPVVCSILIASNLLPMAEPSFTLKLSDGGVELTKTVGLLVAANEEVAWDVGNVPLFSTGEAKQITVEITNTGNTPLQRQVTVTEPEDWSVEVDGNDIVSLDVGQATLVRLTVRGDVPGSASIGLSLSQSTASQASYSIAVTAEGEPIGTSANAGLSTTVAIALFVAILLVAFAALGIQAMRSRSETPPSFHPAPTLGAVAASGMVQPRPTVPVVAAVAAAAPTPLPTPAATPPPMCWTCRQPITTAMLGCPSCGARYHSDGTAGCQASTVQHCVNCQASAEHFVKA